VCPQIQSCAACGRGRCSREEARGRRGWEEASRRRGREAAGNRRRGEARRVGRAINDGCGQEEAGATGDERNRKEAEAMGTSKGMRLELGQRR
jgi:hypothetical protein